MKSVFREIVKSIPPLYRFYNRYRGYRLHEPDAALAHKVLGTSYGAWAYPTDMISGASIVYTFGVGEDISFDLALIERVGCLVHAFDPTPKAISWLSKQDVPIAFKFHNIGLADVDGVVEFSMPESEESHSYSRQTDASVGSVKCAVRRLTTIMRSLDHDHIDLLKMDIEGFEYGVLNDMLASEILPRFLLVEFHHKSFGYGAAETNKAVGALKKAGYKIFWVSELGREYGFCRATD